MTTKLLIENQTPYQRTLTVQCGAPDGTEVAGLAFNVPPFYGGPWDCVCDLEGGTFVQHPWIAAAGSYWHLVPRGAGAPKSTRSETVGLIQRHTVHYEEYGWNTVVQAEFFSGHNVARWGVFGWWSDPTTTRMTDAKLVTLECQGAELVVHGPQRPTSIDPGQLLWSVDLDLIGIADGQGTIATGTMLFPPPGLTSCVDPAVTEDDINTWLAEQAGMPSVAMWPGGVPLSLVAQNPAELPSIGQKAAIQAWRALGTSPWAPNALGSPSYPGTTGGTADNGIFNLYTMRALGTPLMLASLTSSMMQEACRPISCCAAPGRLFRAEDHHATSVLWDCRFHWTSSYRLGKPTGQPVGGVDPGAVHSNNVHWDAAASPMAWLGYDRQHFSINGLVQTYLLTRHPMLRMVLERLAEWCIGMHWTDTASPTVNGPDSGRGIGRGLQALALLLWALGRTDIADVLAARVRMLVGHFAGIQARLKRAGDVTVQTGAWVVGEQGNRTWVITPTTMQGPARFSITTGIYPPGVQSGSLDAEHVRGWEDALAYIGLVHAAKVLEGQPEASMAQNLADQISWAVTFEHMSIDVACHARCTVAICPWDPTRATLSYGTAYDLWAQPAIQNALRLAREAGDQTKADLAQALLDAIKANYTPEQVAQWWAP